ncbi:MAG: hypothetical protein Q9211_000430 [Gyalolechia sp. 1 TL-2023]
MSHPPHTPEQKVLSYTPSSPLPTLSPASSKKIQLLKQKASHLSEQATPDKADPFLQWRVLVIDSLIQHKNAIIEGYQETMGFLSNEQSSTVAEIIKEATKEKEHLEKEKDIILREGRILQEDLQDSPKRVEDAYMAALYSKIRSSSEEGQKEAKKTKKTKKKWSRATFREKLAEYLGSTDDEHPDGLFCNAMGDFAPKALMKAAHIVPYSFQSRELDYLFGTEDSALETERNGLYLIRTVEEQFNNLRITIVPDSSLDVYPIEWKFVVLDETLLPKTYFTSFTDPPVLKRWKDLDGKRLIFQNNNRPARRYLYFKHAMAYMHARIQGFPGFEAKVPSGTMWATLDKNNGYLRRSVLSMIARRIGDDTLPKDLLLTGTFTDTEPGTSLVVRDTLASYTIASAVEKKVKGETLEDSEDSAEEDE